MRIFIPAVMGLSVIGLTPATSQEDAIRVQSADELQEALLEVTPGGVVELIEGRYELSDGLSLDVQGVTIRGAGKNKTTLSFNNQIAGSEGLLITSDHVTLEYFAVENARGDGIKASGVDGITMSGLRVEWTRGAHPENGAYGLYPVDSTNVLIDSCVVIGASDAGIYVGQSRNIIIRNSIARYNVAGFEIENSVAVDLYNNIAEHNTAGFLVFTVPRLEQQGERVRLFDNISRNNNTNNFAAAGNVVARVATGTGIMVMSGRDVEIFGNTVAGNQSFGLLIASNTDPFTNADYDPHPRAISVHHNQFSGNGMIPHDKMGIAAGAAAGVPLPDIVWDGMMRLAHKDRVVSDSDRYAIHDNGEASFIRLGFTPVGNSNGKDTITSTYRLPLQTETIMTSRAYAPLPSTDLSPFRQPRPPLPAVILPVR